MEMFSEELKILDDNTVQYMIDIMQEKLDSQNKQIQEKDLLLEQKNQQLLKLRKEIEELTKHLAILEISQNFTK